jgi:predicted metal-dependent RNase
VTDLDRVMRIIGVLEDLKKQATIERSHFYVDSVATEAIAVLYDCAKQMFGEKREIGA